jgi:hypothetical protein
MLKAKLKVISEAALYRVGDSFSKNIKHLGPKTFVYFCISKRKNISGFRNQDLDNC